MKSQDFTTTFSVNNPAQDVFNAINNVRGWWSENIEGHTNQLHSEFSYHYQDVHLCKMRITEYVPGEKVVWHVLDNHFKFTKDPQEWKDTDVIFEISEKEGQTQVKFTHKGLVPDYECYQICHDAWTHYIQGSLKSLIQTGKGEATPKDVDGGSNEASSLQDPDHTPQGNLKSICQRLRIDTPVETVYKALTTQEGLAGWWTPDTVAKPEIGSVLRFTFGPDYFKEMRVEELKPYSRVKWVCLTAQEEWIGTTLTFDLEAHAKGCVLFFRHEGWKDYTPEMASCTYAWALFFRSLKLWCETGKGLPYPDFDKQ